jgi:hypothetical protein
MAGPFGELVGFGVLALIMFVVVGLGRVCQSRERRDSDNGISFLQNVESTAIYRKYVLASVSSASGHGWNHHVRPVLDKLTERCDILDHASDHVQCREIRSLLERHDIDCTNHYGSSTTIVGPGPAALEKVIGLLEQHYSHERVDTIS